MGLFDFLFGPPSRDKFAQRMTEAMRQAGVNEPIRYDKKEFRLHVGKDQIINLENMYGDYCRIPKHAREPQLQRFARSTFQSDIPEGLEDALPNLVPRVRDRFFYESFHLNVKIQGRKGFEIAHEPLAEHFAIELAYDLPDSIATVSSEKLQKWGVTLHEMVDRCLPVLKNATQRKLKTVRYGLYVADWQDNYDASRILLKDFIRSHEVHGEPVLAIPNRDTLILTGSQDEPGLKAMVELASKALEGPRPMFGLPLILSEGTYLPLNPEPGTPAYSELKLFCLQTLGTNYKQQGEQLNALHEREKQDIFVASYTATENKEKGTLRSMCSWTQGIVSLLPQTDVIALVQEDSLGNVGKGSPIIIADWSRVAAVAGHLMKPLDLYPTRYRVTEFPSPQQIADLKRDEIS